MPNINYKYCAQQSLPAALGVPRLGFATLRKKLRNVR